LLLLTVVGAVVITAAVAAPVEYYSVHIRFHQQQLILLQSDPVAQDPVLAHLELTELILFLQLQHQTAEAVAAAIYRLQVLHREDRALAEHQGADTRPVLRQPKETPVA
jgi:hypothetical protein